VTSIVGRAGLDAGGMTGRTRPLAVVPGLLELAQAQEGVVHRAQLASLGVTKDHVRRQVLAQRWATVSTQVVALMTGPLSHGQLRRAALLHVGERAILDGLTALELHGLTDWATDTVHVLAPHGTVASPIEGVVVHRSRHLESCDATSRAGFPTATVARATVDAASRMRERRSAAGVVHAAVQQRLVTPDGLAECLDRMSNVRFVDTIRRAIVSATDGADAQSEEDMTRLLRRAGLTSYRRQHVVMTSDGPRRYDLVVDLPDGTLLLVEVDGPRHDDPRRRAADMEKDASAIAAGHRVLRVPVVVLTHDEASVVRRFAGIRASARARSR
jgi:very-short-patch-repair endonuclease